MCEKGVCFRVLISCSCEGHTPFNTQNVNVGIHAAINHWFSSEFGSLKDNSPECLSFLMCFMLIIEVKPGDSGD